MNVGEDIADFQRDHENQCMHKEIVSHLLSDRPTVTACFHSASATFTSGDLYLGTVRAGTFCTLWGYPLSKVLAIPFTHDCPNYYLRAYLESYSSLYLSVPANTGDATQRALAKRKLSGQPPSSVRWLYFVIVGHSEAADYLRDYFGKYSYQVSTSED